MSTDLQSLANTATVVTVIAASIIATTSGDPDRVAEARAYLVGFLVDTLAGASESVAALDDAVGEYQTSVDNPNASRRTREAARAAVATYATVAEAIRGATEAAEHLAAPELAQRRGLSIVPD
jgi:hypothetical protein